MRQRISALVVSASIVFVSVAPAAAQGTATSETVSPDADRLARGHYEAGQAYYSEARYADAVREFEEAYRLSHRPEMLFNMGNAYEHDLRFADAADALERYLAAAPDATERTSIEARIARFRRLAAEGSHATTTSGEATPPPPTETTTAPPTTEPSATPPRASAGPSLDAAPFILLGGAVLAMGAAIGTGVVASNDHGTLVSNCPGGVCTPEYQGTLEEGRRLASASIAMWAIAGAAAIAGGIWLAVELTSSSGSSSEHALRLVPSASPTFAGLTLTGEL
jgi:tetratricopeptide (TPR) repeat protein